MWFSKNPKEFLESSSWISFRTSGWRFCYYFFKAWSLAKTLDISRCFAFMITFGEFGLLKPLGKETTFCSLYLLVKHWLGVVTKVSCQNSVWCQRCQLYKFGYNFTDFWGSILQKSGRSRQKVVMSLWSPPNKIQTSSRQNFQNHPELWKNVMAYPSMEKFTHPPKCYR